MILKSSMATSHLKNSVHQSKGKKTAFRIRRSKTVFNGEHGWMQISQTLFVHKHVPVREGGRERVRG